MSSIGVNVSETMGFEQRTDSQIIFSGSTLTFSIFPNNVSSFDIWVKGTKFTKTTLESIFLPSGINGLIYICYNSSGNLVYLENSYIFGEYTPVAGIYLNPNTPNLIMMFDERHGTIMDWKTHKYLHNTRGSSIYTGFDISYTVGSGSSVNDVQYSLTDGIFYDEDLEISVTNGVNNGLDVFVMPLQNVSTSVLYNLNGATYATELSQIPLYVGPNNRPYYNSVDGTLVESSSGKFIIQWVVASNMCYTPVVNIMGQGEYDRIIDAENTPWDSMNIISLPIEELRPLYKLIFQVDNTYTNGVKSRLIRIDDIRSIDALIGVGVTSSYNTGPQGAQGPQGLQGNNGISFNTTASSGLNQIPVFDSSVNLTVGTQLPYIPGNSVVVNKTSDPLNYSFEGTVYSYNSSTGAMIIYSIKNIVGLWTAVYATSMNVNLDGIDGPQGIQGSQGFTGATGSQGDTGATGAQGNSGVSFNTTAPGLSNVPVANSSVDLSVGTQLPYISGNSVLVNNTSLPLTYSFEGRVYSYNSSTGAMRIDSITNISGDWNLVYLGQVNVNLDGIDGPQGAQGSQGSQGSQGAQGVQGTIGPQGSTLPILSAGGTGSVLLNPIGNNVYYNTALQINSSNQIITGSDLLPGITGGGATGYSIGSSSYPFKDITVYNKFLTSDKNNNILIGNDVSFNTTVTNNIAIGTRSLNGSQGNRNIGIGSYTLDPSTNNMTGSDNIAFGYNSLTECTTGNKNISIGYSSMLKSTTGANNVVIGYNALSNTANPSNAVIIGSNAALLCTSATDIIAIGVNSLNSNSGSRNIAIGNNALQANTTANDNLGIGIQTLRNTTTGTNNLAIGYQTLFSNVIGTGNMALGYQSLYSNTGSYNTAIGYQSLYSNVSSTRNIAIGYQTLYNTTTGYNTAIGSECMVANRTGSNNTAVGYGVFVSSFYTNNSVAIGYQCLGDVSSGTGNVGVGYNTCYTGRSLTLTNCSFLGSSSDLSSNITTCSQSTAIGYNAKITGNNQIVMGTSSELMCVPGKTVIGNTVTSSSYTMDICGTANISGATRLASTLAITGDVSVNTNKFNITAASGNTSIAGTMSVTGATTLASTLDVSGNVNIDLGKLYSYPGGTTFTTSTTMSDTLSSYYQVDISGASNINITLPNATASKRGQVITFYNLTSNTGNALLCQGSDKLYGYVVPSQASTSFTMGTAYATAVVQCAGLNRWYVLSYN